MGRRMLIKNPRMGLRMFLRHEEKSQKKKRRKEEREKEGHAWP